MCQLQESLNASLLMLMVVSEWFECNTEASDRYSKGIRIRLTTELTSSIIVFDNWVLIQPFREFHNKNGGCCVSNECSEDLMELWLFPTIYEVDPLKFEKGF